MFKNYVKITFRNILKHKTFSLINVSGLAVGMALCLLILLYIRFHLSFDAFHENRSRIYRVVMKAERSGSEYHRATVPLPLAPALQKDFPEVESTVRYNQVRRSLVSVEEHHFYEVVYYAEPSFFDIFSFRLAEGDPNTALTEPYSVVITSDMALKYFGDAEPLGKVLTIDGTTDFTIKGVFEELPKNTHFRFTMLASFSSLQNQLKDRLASWTSTGNDYTYILLRKGVDPKGLNEKLPDFMDRHLDKNLQGSNKPYLQPLKNIHFTSLDSDNARTISRLYITVFSTLALFILLIACINFMNLMTARSSVRVKEVCVRKVVGAQRTQLVRQFLSESTLMAFLSMGFALVLAEIFLPEFNNLVREELSFGLKGDWILSVFIVGIALTVGLIAGSYPSFYLSRFHPAGVLRTKPGQGSRTLSLRALLVIFQFTLSIGFIVGTNVVFDQANYLKRKSLGFDKEQLVVISLHNALEDVNIEVFKNALLQNPAVLQASASHSTPGSGTTSTSNYSPEGLAEEERIHFLTIYCDENFLETYGLELTAGRNFSKLMSTDKTQSFIINETLARKMSWESPLGKFMYKYGKQRARVIGVVKDFHYLPLQNRIAPMVIRLDDTDFNYVTARIHADDAPRTVSFLESTWKRFAPDYPFTYYFMNERFEEFCRTERITAKGMSFCAGLAVLISCLGILGLISFTAEQRTKEIGIRRVLGASVTSVFGLLSKDVLRWVMLANVIAWPVSYILMSRWLEGFPYRTGFRFIHFFTAAVLTAAVAVLAVSVRALKAARANPVEILRYE